MAANIPAVWGIDLGMCALKAVKLEVKDGQVVATAFEYIEHPKILSQPDADPDELVREALGQFLERNQIRGDFIAIGVPGQSGLARFVKLPPVAETKIADIVKFEAKQQIPFPLDEVIWDFQRLNKGEIIDGLALETEIGLFAMKKDMVYRALQQFKQVDIEVHLVQMAPLAICNFIAYDLLQKGADTVEDDEESNDCIIGLEIGTDNSNLVITNGGRIIWQRPIPIGGNHFTRALTKEMKLTFAKAEHLKKNAAKSPDLKKILSSLKQVLNEFVGEVQRSVGYFTNTHRHAEIQYMVGMGNAFRLPGLQKFLQDKLQIEVRKFQSFERTEGDAVTTAPTFAENILSFAVAYGLALQGLKQTRLQTNLLPYDVKLERVIRGKKPWAVAAAAALLFGVILLNFGRGMEKNAVDNPNVIDAVNKVNQAVARAGDLSKKYQGERGKVVKTLLELDMIGAGISERLNWLDLHQYINMSAPQPNGERLAEQNPRNSVNAKDVYWVKDADARKAYDMYEIKKLGAQKNDDPTALARDELYLKNNLIQVNIVGINQLFSDDLGPYYKKLFADGDQLLGMDNEEKDQIRNFVQPKEKQRPEIQPPPMVGWVVEIRAYSYHKQKQQFVEDTFLQNLGKPSSLKEMSVELAKRVERNVSHLSMYKVETLKDPPPGQYKVINKSYLKSLIAGEGQGGPGVRGVDPVGQPPPKVEALIMPPPAFGDALVMPPLPRDQWKPIGRTASQLFVDGGGFGMFPGGGNPFPPGGKGIVEPGKIDTKAGQVFRTEFIILFTWREPILNQQSIDLGDTKKN